jgi:hypothetical protein
MKYGLRELFQDIDIGEIVPPINNKEVIIREEEQEQEQEIEQEGQEAKHLLVEIQVYGKTKNWVVG